jgi:hypothetical protein
MYHSLVLAILVILAKNGNPDKNCTLAENLLLKDLSIIFLKSSFSKIAKCVSSKHTIVALRGLSLISASSPNACPLVPSETGKRTSKTKVLVISSVSP